MDFDLVKWAFAFFFFFWFIIIYFKKGYLWWIITTGLVITVFNYKAIPFKWILI